MIDITAITTPFGLLDADTQKALKAHDGPIQRYSDDGEWVPADNPYWYPGNAYRVKPAPPQPREWIVEIRRDKSAFLHTYHPAFMEKGGEFILVREVLP
jgi:hypothetical protein